MPTCICNNKVDRSDSKILCIVCNNFFHLQCVHINEIDYDFAKTNFKCPKCLSARRSSLLCNDFPVPSEAGIPAGGVSAVVVGVPKNLGTSNDLFPCNTADGSNAEMPLPKAIADMKSQVSDAEVFVPDDAEWSDCVKLLSKEVLLLRKSNEDLNSLVIALRSDNAKLNSKLDNVLNILTNLHLEANNKNSIGTSPKRKKSSSNVATIQTISVDNATKTFASVVSSGIALMSGSANSRTSTAPVARLTAPPSVQSSDNVCADSLAECNVVKSTNKNSLTGANKRANKSLVVGLGDNSELQVIDRKRWFHLSSFRTTISPENIMSFVEKQFGIAKTHLSCHTLVKKDTNVNDLEFVNFKLGISSCFAKRVLLPDLWPANVRIREFVFLEKQIKPADRVNVMSVPE